VADELSLGLAPIIVDEIYVELHRLRGEGTSLLIVEQQVSHALALCDRVVVLDHGTIAWQGAAADAGDHIAEVTGLGAAH
jgi:branched-chain amino acid transport system ATP-binding protein